MIIPAISKSFNGRRALHTREIELPRGCICALIGANGSGKSTFARLLSGEDKGDGGALCAPCPRSTGYMPQRSFPFRMSVEANIRLSCGDRAEARRIMQALGIRHLARRSAKRLSVGEAQRMALARVLGRKWDFVILDEPTASMDIAASALSEEFIKDYCRKNGSTVLWVTHSLQQARRTADYAIFLHEGELVEFDKAEKLLYSPGHAETRRFLEFFGS